jgi:hypothetical protein
MITGVLARACVGAQASVAEWPPILRVSGDVSAFSSWSSRQRRCTDHSSPTRPNALACIGAVGNVQGARKQARTGIEQTPDGRARAPAASKCMPSILGATALKAETGQDAPWPGELERTATEAPA